MRHMQLQICVVAHDIQLHATIRMQHVYTVLIYTCSSIHTNPNVVVFYVQLSLQLQCS
jgi:hypothetical protein